MIGDAFAMNAILSVNFGSRYRPLTAQVVYFQNVETDAGANRADTSPFFAALSARAKIPGSLGYGPSPSSAGPLPLAPAGRQSR